MELKDIKIGVWYKVKYPNDTKLRYFKGKSKDSSEISIAEYYYEGYEGILKEGNISNSDWWKYAEELKDPSEIQHFLPDGHIDKEFIIRELSICKDYPNESIAWPEGGGNGVYFEHLELVSNSIPEYVECLDNYIGYKAQVFTRGKIYKLTSDSNLYIYRMTDDEGETNGWASHKFKPSTEAAYLAQNQKLQGNELLIEAKRRYPPGTKFNSTGGWVDCLIKEDSVFKEDSSGIRVDSNFGSLVGSVYETSTRRWAKIVEKPAFDNRKLEDQLQKMYPYTPEECYKLKESITIDAEISNIRIPKSNNVTLKNTEKEVVINVKRSKPILIN